MIAFGAKLVFAPKAEQSEASIFFLNSCFIKKEKEEICFIRSARYIQPLFLLF
jgi:hypothetical protein